jgi:hypothetical protein
MSQTGVVSWSKTAASNGTADSNVNWQEGMAPSAVNDSARAAAASVAMYRDDIAGSLLTTGTSTAYTLTTNQVFSSLTVLNGQKLKVRFHAANGAAPTLAVDGLTAKPINVTDATAVATGLIAEDSIWDLTYDNTAGAFILSGVPATVQDSTVATASIAASAVTYAKIQNVTDQRLLGNFSGGAAAPIEYSVVGPSVSGTAISFPFAPSSLFVNLQIKVTGIATATVAADQVVMTTGTAYITKAISVTLTLSSSGANGLDTGSRAAATWYYIYAIYNPTTDTVACLASTSSTAPTMPSGYTFKARIGVIRTAAGGTNLMGTYQFGRRVQYVVGLSSTTMARLVIDTAVSGTYSTTAPTLLSVSVADFVPPTASQITIMVSGNYNNAATSSVLVAPSTDWGGSDNGPLGSNGVVWPVWLNAGGGGNQTVNLLLESTSIGWAASANGGAIACLGWEENI